MLLFIADGEFHQTVEESLKENENSLPREWKHHTAWFKCDSWAVGGNGGFH